MIFRLAERKGFTLIEIVVSFLILTVIVGAGVSNFRRLNSRKQVESTAKRVEQAIRDAQKQASAGVKPTGWCNGATDILEYYAIQLGSPLQPNQYRMIAQCSNAMVGPFDFGLNQLSNGAQIVGGTTIIFDLLGRADADKNICVTDANYTFSYSIAVTTGGSVSFEQMSSANTYADQHSHAFTYSYPISDTNTYADQHSHAFTYSYPISHSNTHAGEHSHAYTYSRSGLHNPIEFSHRIRL
jgi:type II secretory pathway pseudopilin PulG